MDGEPPIVEYASASTKPVPPKRGGCFVLLGLFAAMIGFGISALWLHPQNMSDGERQKELFLAIGCVIIAIGLIVTGLIRSRR